MSRPLVVAVLDAITEVIDATPPNWRRRFLSG
jgi:hypothetical protein